VLNFFGWIWEAGLFFISSILHFKQSKAGRQFLQIELITEITTGTSIIERISWKREDGSILRSGFCKLRRLVSMFLHHRRAVDHY
jgi:hypothetical protein